MSDFEIRILKGRGVKRGRGNFIGILVNEKFMEGRKLRKGRRGSVFIVLFSFVKSDILILSFGVKRKGRLIDIDLFGEKFNKRSRFCFRGNLGEVESSLFGLLECFEFLCNKKYRNLNGFRYY